MQTIMSQLDSAFRQAIQDAVGIDAAPLLSVSQSEQTGEYEEDAGKGSVNTATKDLSKTTSATEELSAGCSSHISDRWARSTQSRYSISRNSTDKPSSDSTPNRPFRSNQESRSSLSSLVIRRRLQRGSESSS